HHARILSSLPGATLVGVVDKIGGRAAEIADVNRTKASTNYRDLLGEVDAVTIAVPTELHREIALPFLEHGVPVLVEKPMARSLGEADDLIAAAARTNVAPAVAHTERVNPA